MRVAVLGAGYGGLTVARELEDSVSSDVEILVVEESGRHLIRHEVHRVIRRPDMAPELEVPLEEVLSTAEICTDRVHAIDRDRRRVELADREAIDYDYAAICLGAETAYYERDGLREYGLPLRDISDARKVRNAVLELLEEGGRVVVGGAGLSGIQVAGELAELAREEDATEKLDVLLVEMEETIAPGFGGQFQDAITEELRARDVEIRTGVTIEDAAEDELQTEGGAIPFEELVWTGGITGPGALAGDRATVRGDLRLDDRTFVAGDAARVVDRNGEEVPASAQAAIAEGETAAANIATLLSHDPTSGGFEPRLESLSFSPTAWIVSVGNGAVATLGPSVLRGRAALALKASVGVGHRSSIGATDRVIEHVRNTFSP